MHQLLLNLIETRGVDVGSHKAFTAQVVLDGGAQVAGAISWHPDPDSGHTHEGYFRALSLAATDPRQAPQMVEFFFAPEAIRTIIAPADEGMRDTYEAMFNGPKSSGIIAPS